MNMAVPPVVSVVPTAASVTPTGVITCVIIIYMVVTATVTAAILVTLVSVIEAKLFMIIWTLTASTVQDQMTPVTTVIMIT